MSDAVASSPGEACGRLDFCEGWPPEYRREVDQFFADRPAARRSHRKDADQLLATLGTPEGWMARWGTAAGTDDAHNWEVACHLPAVGQDAMIDGDDGYWDDWTAMLTPWGCDPSAIHIPVRLWHGVRDRAVPIVHGRWLAAHVPGILAHLVETEDHTNIEHNNREAAYAWLSGLA